jgi:hypothetical protein
MSYWMRVSCIALIVFACRNAPAIADPILYDVTINGLPGEIAGYYLSSGLYSIDLSKSGPFLQIGTLAQYGYLSPSSGTVEFNQTATLDFHPIVGHNADGSSIDAPGVTVTVPISGTVQGQPGVGLGAGWNGKGQIASLDDPAGPPVPQALLNLLAHPEGVSISGVATGGVQNQAESALTINASIAPAAIPEPSALAIILTGAAAYAIRRLKQRCQEPFLTSLVRL